MEKIKCELSPLAISFAIAALNEMISNLKMTEKRVELFIQVFKEFAEISNAFTSDQLDEMKATIAVVTMIDDLNNENK